MATKKITDLVEITTAASDDVLPIVDVSLDITNKITTTNLLKSKQDVLESGTNIKTINSTSLLGSGDISIEANPSGGAGSIQFSDGSAFASDSNLVWDNTNKRLGVGNNAPTDMLTIGRSGSGATVGFISSQGVRRANINTYNTGFALQTYDTISMNNTGNGIGKSYYNSGAMWGIKGEGSTSATTSLLVQNSSGTELLKVRDDGLVTVKGENVITQTSVSPNSVSKMWAGSQAQYDALTPDSSTVYFIV